MIGKDLEQTLRDTLDRSLDQIDDHTVAALAQARAAALTPRRRWPVVVGGLALAATVAGIVATLPRSPGVSPSAVSAPPLAELAWQEDPDMLNDMELLLVLGDDAVGGPDAG